MLEGERALKLRGDLLEGVSQEGGWDQDKN